MPRTAMPENAQNIIDSIREGQLASSPDVLDSLSGAIDRLEKAFPRFGSFVMEFLQNADDAGSRQVSFAVGGDALQIVNDGQPFEEPNVRSICKVGRSTKTPKDYIGYLGVGFKAAFLVADEVEIVSGDYRFAFDRSHWPDPRTLPWQVLPIWRETPKGLLPHGYTTSFHLPLRKAQATARIASELTPDQLNNRILLFLRSVKQVEVDYSKGAPRRLLRVDRPADNPSVSMCELKETSGSSVPESSYWVVFRKVCPVPPEVRTDHMTALWERADVESREVVAAFRTASDGRLIRESGGTAHMGVYSFLPMKEVESGLGFLIQADFLTNPGRSELSRQAPWNEWLAQETFNLLRDVCIPAFREDPRWRFSLAEVLHNQPGGHELFEEYVKRPLRRYLQEEPILLAEDGTWATKEDLVSISEPVRKLLRQEDISLLFPKKKLIHPDCATTPTTAPATTVKQVRDILDNNRGERMLARYGDAQDVEWFGALLDRFCEDYSLDYFKRAFPRYNVEHDGWWDQLQDYATPMILSQDGTLLRISDARLPPLEGRIPAVLEGHFKIVHADLAADSRFLRFRKHVIQDRYFYRPRVTRALTHVSQDEIKEALSRREATKLTEADWEKKTLEERLDALQVLKEAFDAGLPLDQHMFLTLPSKAGTWQRPETLVLPDRFEPEGHRLESLRRRGLFDLDVAFVDDTLMQEATPDAISSWREFLLKLGVDKIVEGRRAGWTARVGILTALQYEREKGWAPRELGESERPGYDIESSQNDAVRFIEVKASAQMQPDISLTANEYAALAGSKKGESYFVYVAVNALRDPRMSVVSGRKLRKLDTRISVSYGQWSTVTDGDPYRPKEVQSEVVNTTTGDEP